MRTRLVVTFICILSVCWGFRSYIGVMDIVKERCVVISKGPLKDQEAGFFRNVDKHRQSVTWWKTWFLSDAILSVSKAWIDGSCVCINMYMKLHGVGHGQTETLLFVIINVLDVFQVWGSRLLCLVCRWNWSCLSSYKENKKTRYCVHAQGLGGETEGCGPFGRLLRWEDHTETDFSEIKWVGVD
jgi:hypothetical protein